MKILKILLIVIGLLAAVLFGGGMFLSPQFKVTRSVMIAAPADRIYGLIADPREWKRWSVWNQRDPKMKIEYSGPPSGTGAAWSWKSESEGDGRMTFTEAVPGRHVAYELVFPDFGTTSNGEIEIAPDGAGSRVTWAMNGNMGSNPLFRWFALNADSMVGKDFEAGLANLKALAEKP
ncbi:SRPBCC family protein [Aquincola sp. S2]|uniref:SRPBCC family protein n=1 Tax=Pseudaquabacterium terrae TaxID=2732868 RepID=A0ABX2EHG1_9BURK|nr:SRPBCC family protein [Aquabacterium terrae]NRF68011.1 SRPBCC family protein [Aquabacterium terrae]